MFIFFYLHEIEFEEVLTIHDHIVTNQLDMDLLRIRPNWIVHAKYWMMTIRNFNIDFLLFDNIQWDVRAIDELLILRWRYISSFSIDWSYSVDNDLPLEMITKSQIDFH